MAGKHDKVPEDDAAAKLLMTGPIVIRGLGRGVKDAFLPGRVSRHRAFRDGDDPTPATDPEPTGLLPETPSIHAGADVPERKDRASDAPDEADEPGSVRPASAEVLVVAEAQRTLFPSISDDLAEEPASDELPVGDPADEDAVPGGDASAEADDDRSSDLDGVVPSDGSEEEEERSLRDAATAPDGGLVGADADRDGEALGDLEEGDPRDPEDLEDEGDLDEQDLEDVRGSEHPMDHGGRQDEDEEDREEPERSGPQADAPRPAPVPAFRSSSSWGSASFPFPLATPDPRSAEDAIAVTDVARAEEEPPGETPEEPPPGETPEEEPLGGTPDATAEHPAATGGGRPPSGPRGRIGREAIGIVVLVVLALVCAGLITAVVLKTQADAATAARESADYTPPPLTTPTPSPTGPSVAIIGDASATTAASGVDADERWPALLRSGLSGTVTTLAADGSGYATKTSTGSTFVQLAAKVPTTADVVVVVGGTADASVSSLSLASAATDAVAAVKDRAPDAEVLLIGPVIDGGLSAADLRAVRDGLQASARIAGATWVDPIDGGWLPEKTRAADSPDRLTAANEKTIASKVQASIERALG